MRREHYKRAGIAAAIAAVSVLGAPHAGASPEDPFGEDWVAMAVSPAHGNGGYGAAGNPDEAVRIALRECNARSNGDPCVVATAMQYGCVAFAWNSTTRAWAGGRGPDLDAAVNDAAGKLPPFVAGEVTGGGWCSTPAARP